MENLVEVIKEPINEIIVDEIVKISHHDEWDNNFGDHSISSF